MRKIPIKYIFVSIILIAFLIVRFSGIYNYFSVQFFQEHAGSFHNFVNHYYLTSVAVFLICYAIIVASALPLTPVFNIAAGYFFGAIFGAAYAIAGATLGAVTAFFMVRYLFRAPLRKKYGHKLDSFNEQFKKRGASYLLFLVLLPITPYSVVTVIAGISSVSWFTFAWTTAVGTIPTALIYSFAGKQLMHITKPSDIVSPQLIGALVLLALFALLPIVFKNLRQHVHMP